jgi:hypothetical protein
MSIQRGDYVRTTLFAEEHESAVNISFWSRTHHGETNLSGFEYDPTLDCAMSALTKSEIELVPRRQQ